MSNFSIAYTRFIQPNEGGYSNVKEDKGGETYAGIARNIYSNWKGWALVDLKKANYNNGIIPRYTLFKDSDLQYLVDQFYFDLWNKNRIGEIKSQDVANILFDFFINSGGIAFKKIQQLVNVTADGVIGSQTIAAINGANASTLYNDLLAVRKNFYDAIVKRDPTQSKFYNGWMARLAKFPKVALPIVGIIGALLIAGAIWYSHSTKEKNKSAMMVSVSVTSLFFAVCHCI